MALKNAKPKEKFVPSYQISGKPFVTSSATQELSSTTVPTEVRFPTVTRWVQIRNTGGDTLAFGLSSNGVLSKETANFMELAAGTTSPAFEFRCKSVFLIKNGTTNTDFTLIAGLTDIPDLNTALTGSEGIG